MASTDDLLRVGLWALACIDSDTLFIVMVVVALICFNWPLWLASLIGIFVIGIDLLSLASVLFNLALILEFVNMRIVIFLEQQQ